MAALAVVLSAADKKPDYSGVWILNANRSEYGDQIPPKSLIQKVAHQEPSLSVESTETSPLDQAVKLEMKYTTDGKECLNKIQGTEVRATATWEGNELLIHSWSQFGGSKIDLTDRWRLTDSGTTLVVQRHVEGNAGKFDQTIVFDKK